MGCQPENCAVCDFCLSFVLLFGIESLREYWMSYRGSGFLAHTSSSLLSRQQLVSLSHPFCVSPVKLTERRGGRGWAWSRIVRPQESFALYKPFNTLWSTPFKPIFADWFQMESRRRLRNMSLCLFIVDCHTIHTHEGKWIYCYTYTVCTLPHQHIPAPTLHPSAGKQTEPFNDN